jgi:hypothetical protein
MKEKIILNFFKKFKILIKWLGHLRLSGLNPVVRMDYSRQPEILLAKTDR